MQMGAFVGWLLLNCVSLFLLVKAKKKKKATKKHEKAEKLQI